MRLQFMLSEIAIGLRRNLSIAVSVMLVTMVSVYLMGIGFLAQGQVDTLKGYWYDRIQVSIFMCGEDSAEPNCAGRAVTGGDDRVRDRQRVARARDAAAPSLARNVPVAPSSSGSTLRLSGAWAS